jgi:uncharacterized protein YdaU (DUF1376 family)
MTKAPAFQFYPKDWLSSPRVQLMTPAQEGAYVRLLCYCWDSGDCSIPDDDAELAILSRLGEGWLNGGSAVVRKCFMPHPSKPGYLTNQRLLDEAEKQTAWQRKSAEGGRKSAEKRSEKKRLLNGGSTTGSPDVNRPVQPLGNSSSSSASSSAEEIEDGDLRASAKTPFERIYDYGCSLFPQLTTQTTSAIHQWLDAGADVNIDIIPEMKRLHGKGVQPRGWGLFTQDIANAKARRKSPMPKGESTHARPAAKHAGFEKQDYFAGTEGFEVVGGPSVSA